MKFKPEIKMKPKLVTFLKSLLSVKEVIDAGTGLPRSETDEEWFARVDQERWKSYIRANERERQREQLVADPDLEIGVE